MGTGPYAYSWNTSPAQFTDIALGLPSGTYEVTVTDANGCVDNASVFIPQPAALSGTIDPTHVSCAGAADGTATVLPNGGTLPYTFAWNMVPINTLPTATGLTAGNWEVTVTDANGCVSVVTTQITEPLPLVGQIMGEEGICEGESIMMSADAAGGVAPYTYSWFSLPTGIVGSGTPITVTPGASSALFSIVTDANGCVDTATAFVEVYPTPIANFTASELTGCDLQEVEFSNLSTGAVSWMWDFGNGEDKFPSLSKSYFWHRDVGD